jgi:hypothetical protein
MDTAVGAVRVNGSMCEYGPMPAIEVEPTHEKKKKEKEKIQIPLSERPTLSVDEFCAMIGIGRSTFYKAKAAGDVVPCKYGKRTFVTQDEAKRFVRNMPGNKGRSR